MTEQQLARKRQGLPEARHKHKAEVHREAAVMAWRRQGDNTLKEVRRAYRDTKPVKTPAKHKVKDETILIPMLSEDITEEAVKVLEETSKVLNTTELEEPAKHEVLEEMLKSHEETKMLEETTLWAETTKQGNNAELLKGIKIAKEELPSPREEEPSSRKKLPKAKMEEANDLAAAFREETPKQKKAIDYIATFNAKTKELMAVQKKAMDLAVNFNAESPHAGTQVEEELSSPREEPPSPREERHGPREAMERPCPCPCPRHQHQGD